MNLTRALCFAAAAALIVACSSAESDWSQASQTNTIAAYQDFLSKQTLLRATSSTSVPCPVVGMHRKPTTS